MRVRIKDATYGIVASGPRYKAEEIHLGVHRRGPLNARIKIATLVKEGFFTAAKLIVFSLEKILVAVSLPNGPRCDFGLTWKPKTRLNIISPKSLFSFFGCYIFGKGKFAPVRS